MPWTTESTEEFRERCVEVVGQLARSCQKGKSASNDILTTDKGYKKMCEKPTERGGA